MVLTISIKNVYGTEMVYPACDQSRLLVKLLKSKTFTKQAIYILKQLGYTFKTESKTV